jgi:tetratricopeptide (TPR) repeat protein
MTARSPRPSLTRRLLARRRCVTLIIFTLTTAGSMTVLAARVALAADQPSPPQEDREQQARRLYAEGEAAFKAGQYAIALKAFEAGYAASPRSGFLLNMAHTERKLGELRKARALYKKFLLVDPTSRVRGEVTGVINELDSALADEDQAPGGKTAAEEEPAQKSAPTVLPKNGVTIVPPPAAPPTPADAPMLTTSREPSSPPDASAKGSPFYRRPWFWIAVGVAVAAGAGAALYASQRPGADPFHSSGSLGAIGP